MAEYLGMVQLGGLYKKGKLFFKPKALKRPGASGQETPAMSGGLESYFLGDTPADSQQQLMWHKIQDEGNTLLVCDRNILVCVSWNDLDQQGYISGKSIQVDGVSYVCRVLTGGTVAARYQLGEPAQNEWDRFICGAESIPGLPKPQLLDLGEKFSTAGPDRVDGNSIPSFPKNLNRPVSLEDKNSENNHFWHWEGCSSWCREKVASKGGVVCVYRGGMASSTRLFANPDSCNLTLGFRPVLELTQAAQRP